MMKTFKNFLEATAKINYNEIDNIINQFENILLDGIKNKKTEEEIEKELEIPFKIGKINIKIIFIVNESGVFEIDEAFWAPEENEIVFQIQFDIEAEEIPKQFLAKIKSNLIHEISHAERDISSLSASKDKRFHQHQNLQKKHLGLDQETGEISTNYKYERIPDEIDANISVMKYTYDNIPKEKKENITLKNLLILSKFSSGSILAYGKESELWRKNIMKRLAREGIILRNSGF